MPLPSETSAPPTNVRRLFWDWSRPVLACAVEELTKDWTGGALDLSHLAVIVPTENAGRKLREALAAKAAQQDAAVLSPEIITPHRILDWAPPRSLAVAGTAESLLAWVEVLQAVHLDEVRNVFPRDPASRDFSWALQTATNFRRLQRNIGEAGWSLAQATARFGAGFTEASRWQELTALEKRYEAVLYRNGLIDSNRAQASAIARLVIPTGIRKLFILATPDPFPLACMAWQMLAEKGLPIDVCIHAPAAEHNGFDAWGQPVADYWKDRVIPLAQPRSQIRLLPRPASQADEITRLCSKSSDPAAELAVGIVDPEILPHAMVKLDEESIPHFNPEGDPFSNHALHWVLTLWQELLAARSWQAFARLLRVPEVQLAIKLELPEAVRNENLMRQADKLQETHLPATLDAALQALGRMGNQETAILHALRVVRKWMETFQRTDFSYALTKFLESIYQHQELPFGSEAARAFLQASRHLLDHLASVVRAVKFSPTPLEPAQQLHLLLRLMKEITLFPEVSDGRLELSGWLELHWQNAPGLVVAGFNEGFVPPSIISDPWLPHSLRGLLGLKTNDSRFARDAYLLAAMLASRDQSTGQIHLLLGRESGKGDPLKPSRLLMLCKRDELADRVQFLFEEASSSDAVPSPPWQQAWKLKPRIPATWEFKKISATAFSKYLDCPFRFFLQHVLRMEDYDPGKQEMDHFDFGNLCHQAFQAFGEDEQVKQSTNPAEIANFLKSAAAQQIEIRYGKTLSVPLIIQQTSIQQRLAAAAPFFAQSREAGWQVRYVEQKLDQILGEPWTINGIEIRGQIDMVEYHPELKRWRITDYKTSAKPVMPHDAHLKKGTPGAHQEHLGEAVIAVPGKPQLLWTNLQLPLYAAALQQHFKQPVDAVYFNLPPAISQVGIMPWPELEELQLTDKALACAAAIIEAIKQFHFWPPNQKVKYDDFSRLFIDDVMESIDPTGLLKDAETRRQPQLSTS